MVYLLRMGLLENITSGTNITDLWITNKSLFRKRWKAPNFDASQIRLVIYSDHDGERQIIFDSKSVKKVDEQAKGFPPLRCKKRENSLRLSPSTAGEHGCQRFQPKYQLTKPGSDVKMLEEVMFGSVGMAHKGTSLKVHFLRSRMLLTKVFIPELQKQDSLGCEIDLDRLSYQSSTELSSPKLISQQENSSSVAQSVPVDVPSPPKGRIASFDIYDRDSGLASLTSSGSFHTPFPSPGSNASSYSSLHRRWIRSMSKSIEGCIRKRNSQDNLVAQDNPPAAQGGCRRRRSKFAMGIVFGCEKEQEEENNLLFQNFFFSHITLLEGHLERLKIGVEKACYKKKRFVDIVMEALESFQNDVVDLYTTPRLCEPVWLTMMSQSSYRYQLCEHFMKELMSLITKFDNKSTDFFMSTLVTAVLTHHLAWVPTVTPAGGTPSKTYLHNHSAKWVDTLAKTHPYNPLWAQLGDMYGAIGYPLKLARTIIVGKKADLVKKILYILSYFIRCSDVQENSELGTLESFLEDLQLESPDEKTPVQEFGFASSNEDNVKNHFVFPTESSKKETVIKNFSDEGTEEKNASHSKMFSGLSPQSKAQTDICSGDSFVQMRVHENDASRHDAYVHDEGYCSIVHSDENEHGLVPCRLSVDNIVENVPVENVVNVHRAVVTHANNELTEKCSSPVKPQSLFSKQLSSGKEVSSDVKLSKEDLKQKFWKEGSNSMFNEYFEDNTIETKTIDEIPKEKLVINHAVLHEPSMSRSLDCLSEASGNITSEMQGNHHSRLGSVGHVARPKHFPLSRQISSEWSKPSSMVPGRCRSVTPTELNRRRHLSSTSSFDFDHMDPLVCFKELSMPDINSEQTGKSMMFDRNFGRSLLAGYSDHYLSNFVLHGTSDSNYKEKLLSDLQMTTQHSVLDETIEEAVFIVADTDKWSVDITSSHLTEKSPKTSRVIASQLVCNMMEAVLQLHKLKMSSEFCLMHLEDRMQEIYFKSIMLSEYLRDRKESKPFNIKEITQLLQFDEGDLPLLDAIAGTHSPNLSLNQR